jgi:CheY-like chemotaxis protein
MVTASRQPRVLAVDDTPANLVALEAVLSDRYEIVKASSGPEALAILGRDADVDVIIMDVMMPGMDGYQAAERIKKMPGCEDIPLVFITAVYREDPHVKRGYAVGAVDYFTKPFDPDLLRFKVNVYASFRHRAQVLRVRERQLQESEDVLNAARKLESVLEGLPVGVIIADVAGRICQTNDQVLRIIKCGTAVANDAYGQVIEWWRRNEAALKEHGSPLARALESGESLQNQIVQLQFLDGTSASLLESTSPLRGADGSIVGAVLVLQDVTNHRRVAAEFEKRIARLVSVGIELEGVTHRAQG